MDKYLFIIILQALFIGDCLAENDLYNPLISYKEQLRILHKDCRDRQYDKDCAALEQKLGNEMLKIKEICKEHPEDERCGAVMKEKKEVVNTLVAFCQANPHAKKCVVRRTRTHRREKLKRLFCSKNPEEKRCHDNEKDKAKRGFAHFCKLNPENRRCKIVAERKVMKNPPTEPESNGF